MVTEFHALSPHDTLGEAVRLTLAGPQADFPVLEGDQVVGVLTQSDLLQGLAHQGSDSIVSHVMHGEFVTANESENLEHVFKRLQTCECRTLPVLANGRLVGLLTRDNLAAFLSIQGAMAEEHHGPGSGPELAKSAM